MGLTNLPIHNGKVTSDKKMICKSNQWYNGGNREFFCHFPVIFKITSKFLIVFVGLILGKMMVEGFNRPQQETDIRYEFGLKVILKGVRCK